MKAKTRRIFILAQALILMAVALGPVGPVGETPALAQPASEGEISNPEPNAPNVDIKPTMSYQGRLAESGVPVTGSRSMSFRLYNDATGGDLLWWEGPKTVPVTNGLFTVTLGDTNSFEVDIFSSQLYLEIEVVGTVLPRQVLQGAPYAFSLAPGADVYGTTGESLLYAGNSGWGEGVKGYSYSGNGLSGATYSGHGIYAEGYGSGLNGSALYAKSTGTGGIALVAQNASTSSSDTAMVVENDGTGDLLKGFGGDSGNDEFNFKNDGTFQDKAPSYVFVPGAYAHSTNPQWITATPMQNYALIEPVIIGTNESICLPITLPAVLYGQNVEVEQARIYYHTSDSASYISGTWVILEDGVGNTTNYVIDFANYSSTSPSSYDETPSPNLFMNSNSGFLTMCWRVSFANLTHYIVLEGVRLRLRHHPLY